ncbi:MULTISPECIES: TonB-dependent siderophore receptor [unclassified Oceanobacter]|uniref:TonB-dependent siderophore receptor n=1 Tax=unclassified Oceanobacter TaxID=2620260 RepID=UPI002733E8C1|nr:MULTISPECIES: TonB-dependent receptor [unclassified Oceanobacter]MDP2507165.1 TonB-dependent receptor [Oceanobacter sp. 3_MG-2023]MDP2549233.1 TonB-dependent receptor [Oceanobacter sp. 4_MG-2023]
MRINLGYIGLIIVHLKKSLIMMKACGALVFSPTVFAETASDGISHAEGPKEWDQKIEDQSIIELSPIQVEGRALSLYKEDEAVLGTRTHTPIDETPQSIQVLTQELIDDQAANEVTDLFRSMSGVSYFNYGIIKMRGFEQESQVLYDGVKGDPFRTFTIPQLFNIEEVQVLKGPSGALYGAGEAGGVINYVTKKPTYDQQNTIEFATGNKGFLSGSLESSGGLNEDASQRYRIGVYSSSEDSYRNNVEEDNDIVDLGYAWDINEDATLTLQYTHFYQLGERVRGVPIDEDGNFLTDTSWNSNEPSDNQEFKSDIFQAHLQYSINDWLDSNLTLRYYETNETMKFHQARALVDSDSDGAYDGVTRRYQDQVRDYNGVDLAYYLVAYLGDHTLVTGTDYHFAREEELFYYSGNSDDTDATPSTLSFTNPDYDDDISAYEMSLNRDRTTDLKQVGVYVQDQWRVTNKLNLVAGARLDHIKEDVTDNDDGSDDASYDDVGYSTRIGATYELSKQFKPYASFSTGLTPQAAADQLTSADGSLFDPEENQQVEVGARTYLLDNRSNLNVALFHIVKNNVLTEDPDDDDYSIAIGEIRSQGFEADLLADLTSRWVANVSYTYTDLEVTDTDADARNLSNTPSHQLGGWTRYEFPDIGSSIAFGMDYVSQQTDRDDNTIKPHTIYDMSWQTRWQDWKFQANIKNLLDEEYAIAGFNTVSGAIIGERRRIYLKASYDF